MLWTRRIQNGEACSDDIFGGQVSTLLPRYDAKSSLHGEIGLRVFLAHYSEIHFGHRKVFLHSIVQILLNN